MPIKINNLTISGIRGIQNTINLPLSGKSILLYGENGSGKSSITDAIEWLYKDSVSHLENTEINLKDALRNSYTDKAINSEVYIKDSQSFNISQKNYFIKAANLFLTYLIHQKHICFCLRKRKFID